jgi:hypothetical protein
MDSNETDYTVDSDVLASWFKYQCFNLILLRYLVPLACICSFITNTICFAVYYDIWKIRKRMKINLAANRSPTQMYNYLLLKSICDMLPAFFDSFLYFYFNGTNESNHMSVGYYMQVWRIYFNYYLSKVFYLASGLFEIAASLDCFFLINRNMNNTFFMNRQTFQIITLIILIFSFTFHSFYIFSNKIHPVDEIYNNKTVTIYRTIQTSFGKSEISENLNLTHTILRDFIVLLCLLVINTSILLKIKRIRKKKLQIRLQADRTRTKINKAEMKKVQTIVSLCVIYICGHLPYIIYYIPFKKTLFWSYWTNLSEITLHISYITPLAVYYCFNINFRNILIEKILKNNKMFTIKNSFVT